MRALAQPFAQPLARNCTRGFSLVEVVLAVGIFAFAIVVLGGLYGNLMARHKDNKDRQRSTCALAALNEYLARPGSFAKVSDWLPSADSTMDLHYVLFRANAQGGPDGGSDRVIGLWVDGAGGQNGEPTADSLNAVREDGWIRAVLQRNQHNSGTAALLIEAKLYEVPFPSHQLPANALPLVVAPVVVSP